MKKTIRELPQDIAQDLVSDVRMASNTTEPESPMFVGLLVNRLAQEVVDQLDNSTPGNATASKAMETRLQRLEHKLDRLLGTEAEEDAEDASARGSNFPNLKYAKPKYQNVESLLNYVERDDDKGGLKLVIMNFND